METRNSGNPDAGVKRGAKSAARMADKYLAPQQVAGFVAVPATANLPHVSSQSYGVPCPSGYGLALRRDESQRRFAETSVRAGAGLGADARTVSLALGVFSLAKHLPRPSHKPRAALAAWQPVMGEFRFPASAGTSPFRAGSAKLPVIVTPAN
jgi:hypothetical protein